MPKYFENYIITSRQRLKISALLIFEFQQKKKSYLHFVPHKQFQFPKILLFIFPD